MHPPPPTKVIIAGRNCCCPFGSCPADVPESWIFATAFAQGAMILLVWVLQTCLTPGAHPSFAHRVPEAEERLVVRSAALRKATPHTRSNRS